MALKTILSLFVCCALFGCGKIRCEDRQISLLLRPTDTALAGDIVTLSRYRKGTNFTDFVDSVHQIIPDTVHKMLGYPRTSVQLFTLSNSYHSFDFLVTARRAGKAWRLNNVVSDQRKEKDGCLSCEQKRCSNDISYELNGEDTSVNGAQDLDNVDDIMIWLYY